MMGPSAGETFRKRRREIDTILAGLLEGLDTEHYPSALKESMSLALLAGQAPRGLPLLLEVLSGQADHRPPPTALAAFECSLRACLLLAELGLAENESPAAGLGRRLGNKFTRAQVLLTADTLFTWPLELAAQDVSLSGRPLPGEIAAALGAGGDLGALAKAAPRFESLFRLETVERLCRAWTGCEIKDFRLAARWVYLTELRAWYGASPLLDQTRSRLEEEMPQMQVTDDPRLTAAAELISFLRAWPS